MPKVAGDELRKVTLNLYAEDVDALERLYGWGWSQRVRDLISEHIANQRQLLEDYVRGK